ncbi:hypothetical protein NQ176_g9932 [Zarea fungicola]|uniref:Uncharacterized protein n=1 Tax=Zarea fungicola TaxID=93591 RepID=A0ACC1MIP8_9HYPO|nr:hypothetical protein NQ176_g9932 [Lecanicillium fungicola]
MASSSTPADVPAQAAALEAVPVTELPKFDLDLYIQNYTGVYWILPGPGVLLSRVAPPPAQLISCVPLRLEALKAAISEAKNGTDVSHYKQAWDCIRKVAPNEPEATRDDAWIDATEKSNKAETHRLESELKGYKHNLIKESIRMANDDLGRHFEAIGKLNEAADAYTKMRQDVGTTKHVTECVIHLANISLHRRDWNMLLTHVGKITGGQSPEEEKLHHTLGRVMAGVAYLSVGSYSDAAKHLLLADFSVPAAAYSHVASPNDIAVYGGIAALATMDRANLQRRVLENQSFRTFLEQEPHIRKAVSLFVSGRYSSCLSILETYRSDFLLDIYLQKHVHSLFNLIRTKCIVQYFAAFSRITLQSLEAAFGLPGQSLQDELMEMIRNGFLNARIDARNQLLVAVLPDPRAAMQEAALETAAKYEKEATEHLRRISILSAGLEVVPGKKEELGAGAEVWFDDPRSLTIVEGIEAAGTGHQET